MRIGLKGMQFENQQVEELFTTAHIAEMSGMKAQAELYLEQSSKVEEALESKERLRKLRESNNPILPRFVPLEKVTMNKRGMIFYLRGRKFQSFQVSTAEAYAEREIPRNQIFSVSLIK